MNRPAAIDLLHRRAPSRDGQLVSLAHAGRTSGADILEDEDLLGLYVEVVAVQAQGEA